VQRSAGSLRAKSNRLNSRHTRLNGFNDLLWRAFDRANVPAVKEKVGGLLRSDGKRPDGLTQMPRQAGKCMTWNVTVTDTLAVSCLPATSSFAGAAAEGSADRKELKYQSIAHNHTFVPLAIETLGSVTTKGTDFFNQVCRRISACANDEKGGTALLFQRLSLTIILRFNAICFNRSFCFNDADLDS